MLTTSTAWNTNWMFTEYILFQLHKLLWLHNFINSINYSISFCDVYRIYLVSNTSTPPTAEFYFVKFNCINYIDSLNYTISFMSCFNYINSINYIFSFYKDYRICLISTTLTPSTTQFHFIRFTKYVLFQLH